MHNMVHILRLKPTAHHFLLVKVLYKLLTMTVTVERMLPS